MPPVPWAAEDSSALFMVAICEIEKCVRSSMFEMPGRNRCGYYRVAEPASSIANLILSKGSISGNDLANARHASSAHWAC